MTMSISRRAPAAAVAVAVALTLPLAVSGSPQNEEFFESSFDGAWVGSIKVGNERVLVQLNLNVGSSAVGFAVIQNNLGSTPNGVDVLAADFTKVSNKSIVFRADDAAPLRRRRDTTTFKLSPKSGTLKGKASGKVKGAVVLVPVSPDLPLQKLWAGSVRVDGKMLFMLLQLTDNGDGTVGGHAVVGRRVGHRRCHGRPSRWSSRRRQRHDQTELWRPQYRSIVAEGQQPAGRQDHRRRQEHQGQAEACGQQG